MKQFIKDLFSTQNGILYLILAVLIISQITFKNGDSLFGAMVSTISQDSSGSAIVTGDVDADSADSGAPVKVGGVYNPASTTPSYDEGDRGDLEIDSTGILKVTLAKALDYINDSITARTEPSNYNYVAAPAANTVVKSTAGILDAIILGAWVTGGTVECSDHASDGDGNVKVFLTMGGTDESGLPKTVPVNASFATGITCDTIGATQVTFLYK